jgi:hypothetical protein
LLLETEGIQLLLHKRSNAVLDFLYMLMVALIDLADSSKDTLLMLRAAEL